MTKHFNNCLNQGYKQKSILKCSKIPQKSNNINKQVTGTQFPGQVSITSSPPLRGYTYDCTDSSLSMQLLTFFTFHYPLIEVCSCLGIS